MTDIARRIAETEALVGAIAKRIASGGPVSDIVIYERHVDTLLKLQRRANRKERAR